MELKGPGSLRATLNWEIGGAVGIVVDGSTVTLPKTMTECTMTVKGTVYGDPTQKGKGIYLLVGVDKDINGVINAADPAHIPEPAGESFGKTQYVTISSGIGTYPIKAMLCYAEDTATAKSYFEAHPELTTRIGTLRYPDAPPEQNGTSDGGTSGTGLLDRLVFGIANYLEAHPYAPKVACVAVMAIGASASIYTIAINGSSTYL
jgi:hypothetical protein